MAKSSKSSKSESVKSVSRSATFAVIPLASITFRGNDRDINGTEGGEEFESLVASIKGKGVESPIDVVKEGDSYLLLSGRRRFQAATQVGLTTIPAMVWPAMGDTQYEGRAFRENYLRKSLTGYERVVKVGIIFDRFFADAKRENPTFTDKQLDQIARSATEVETGMAYKHLANHIRVWRNLSDASMLAFKDGKVSYEKATVLASLSHEDQAVYLATGEKPGKAKKEEKASEPKASETSEAGDDGGKEAADMVNGDDLDRAAESVFEEHKATFPGDEWAGLVQNVLTLSGSLSDVAHVKALLDYVAKARGLV